MAVLRYLVVEILAHLSFEVPQKFPLGQPEAVVSTFKLKIILGSMPDYRGLINIIYFLPKEWCAG
jgi:hypothetical protein